MLSIARQVVALLVLVGVRLALGVRIEVGNGAGWTLGQEYAPLAAKAGDILVILCSVGIYASCRAIATSRTVVQTLLTAVNSPGVRLRSRGA